MFSYFFSAKRILIALLALGDDFLCLIHIMCFLERRAFAFKRFINTEERSENCQRSFYCRA